MLSTKLSMPPLRPRLVLRSRLLQKLNQGLERGFVLISAPAGYGKSTLLSTWLNRVELPTTWLALDENDNDPVRFLTYLGAAFSKVEPAVRDALEIPVQASQLPETGALLTPLVNTLAQAARPFCLALDDYHVIQNPSIHQMISFLLEHRPASLHLIIATRADPPLPLAKFRARSAMLELRQADLCFTSQEAADFLNRTMHLQVSLEDASRITARTEGWIAGLQMAALSLQTTDDIPGLIATLSGSHTFIFDYLLEEILKQQPPEIRRFLLYTSIADQLNAGLCEALWRGEASASPESSSAAILKALDQANLFILPLDHERRWYRYHHLFADLLRLMLEQNEPGISATLHQRAYRWYEAQGMLPAALKHALAAGDMQRVAQMISANVLVLVENNEIAPTLLRLETIPPEQRIKLPWLGVAHAWALAYTGQMDRAEAALSQAEQHQEDLPQDERNRMMGHIGVVRAYNAWVRGERQKAVEFALDAAPLLPEQEYAVRALNITTLGNAFTQYEPEPRAVQVLEHAVALARQAGQSHVFMPAATALAYACYRLGKFHQAHTVCQEAIELAEVHQRQTGQSLPAAASAYAEMAIIQAEWGDADQAIRTAHRGLALSELWGQADTIMLCLLALSTALSLAQEFDSALSVLHRARKIAQTVSSWFVSIVDQTEIRVCLEAGNIDRAARLAQDMGTSLPASLQASLLVSQNQLNAALAVVEHALPEALSAPSQEAVRLGVIRSMAFFLKGDEKQALAALQQTLALAEEENRVATFLREGAAMERLLRLAQAKSISLTFVQKLLTAFEARRQRTSTPASSVGELPEPLSERELEVLKLLAQGCSDKEIAERLVIARETVHKHLKNIYGKLDVHNRTAAVARARELHLF